MVQEGARSRGAHRVHGEIDHHAVPQDDDLGILAPYLDDGLYVGDVIDDRHGVSRNLVLHHIGSNQIGRQMSGAPRSPDRLYGKGITRLLDNALHPLLDRGDGFSRVSEVCVGDNPIFPIGKDGLGGNGSHIDSQIHGYLTCAAFSASRPCRSPQRPPTGWPGLAPLCARPRKGSETAWCPLLAP